MSTKGNILIVGDELIVRDSLAKWFRKEGYEVGSADSARQALTCWHSSRGTWRWWTLRCRTRMALNCRAGFAK